ncbi:MAG: SelD-related putative sulfur metabolism protein [Acidobacteria bacterium]|nr:SelD-related putative sulfur metabolism protein [Acidobacteriota bacterium]
MVQQQQESSSHVDPAPLQAAPIGLERWRTPISEILSEIRRGQKPREMVCLGCAAKVDLVDTVYPVLAEIAPAIREKTPINLQPRDDVYIFDTDGQIDITRAQYSLAALLEPAGCRAVEQDVLACRPDGAVLLASFTANPTREAFRDAMLAYLESAGRAGHRFTLGKGHTVQLSKSTDEQFLMVDYVRSGRGPITGVANNDTISTIDPNLCHTNWISVFVSLNNALNDLLLSGVTQNLTFHPSYDAPTRQEVQSLKDAIARYQERFRDLDIRVVDHGPLGFGIKAIGATITGTSVLEVPRNENLLEGQILIATRPAGDLAPLTLYLIRQALEEDTSDLEDLRARVLQQMLVPNVEAARVIASYLPDKGKPFDPHRHLTSARDMSGPGILALEELAQDSGRDIYLHNLVLHDPRVADVEMPNPTAGTNGAILIAAHEAVAYSIWRDLEETGHQPWIVGRVGKASDDPTIEIREDLRHYRFLDARGAPFFKNSRWVACRKGPSPGPGRR